MAGRERARREGLSGMNVAADLWNRTDRWIRAHIPQLRQALRMTASALLTLGLGELFGLARGYWAVLTAVLVTQASVGGSIRAAIDRVTGTIAGAIYGAAVALAVPHQSDLGRVLATAAAVAPLALASALQPSLRIAPVTAILVVLIPGDPSAGVVGNAVSRAFEIGFGSVVGLACSVLLLPSRAHRLVADAAAVIARLLADLARLQLAPSRPETRQAAMAVKDKIRAALATLDTAAGEARQERRSYLSGALDPEPLSRVLRRVRDDLVMIGGATTVPLPDGPIQARLQPRLEALAEAVAAVLVATGAALTAKSSPPDLAAVQAARQAYVAEVAAVRREGLVRSLSIEAVEPLFALGFALDELRRDLEDLIARVAEQGGGGQA